MTSVVTQPLPFYGDDVEPYKSAIPCTFNAIVNEWPSINYTNPSLMVKTVLFVGSIDFFSETSPCIDGYVDRTHYSPPEISPERPEIELNSAIEICGTIQDIKDKNYNRITHRVLCDNIYHHHAPPSFIINPPRMTTTPTITPTNTTTSLPPANQQWTNDDVSHLLCKHWNAARQYSLTAKLTHNDDDVVEVIGYYDAIPMFSPSSTDRVWDRSTHSLMAGTVGIISSITKRRVEGESDQINLLIPTLQTSPSSNNPATDMTAFNLTTVSCDTYCDTILPTLGSCVLLWAIPPAGYALRQYGSYVGYLPLLSPHQDSLLTPTSLPSSSSTEFTAEMFQKSSYMTDLLTNATLLKLVNHHHQLSEEIVAKKYDKDNPPPRAECIDITPYLDIVNPVEMQKERERLEQEKLRREKEEQEKQRRLQKLQSDTQFIYDLMTYHQNVAILPVAQKVMQQHPFLSDYITTQIIIPFQYCQQEVHGYLDEFYSQEKLNTFSTTTTAMVKSKCNDGQQQEQHQQPTIYNINNLPPSPLESLMYHDYKDFIQGVQSVLFALSSSSSSSPFFESLLSTSSCYDSEPKVGESTPQTPSATSLLQLQSPHIYHHAHTMDPHRAKAIQRHHQRVLLATSRDLPALSSTTTILLPTTQQQQHQQQSFASLSTTNHPLNDILSKADPTIECLLSDVITNQRNVIPQHEQQHQHQHDLHQQHQLMATIEKLQCLLFNANQHNAELFEQVEQFKAEQQQFKAEQQHQHRQQQHPSTTNDQIPTTTNCLQNQIQQLQQQLEDTKKDFKQQIVAIQQTSTAQLSAKDEQLAAKDKQIQQMMAMIVPLTSDNSFHSNK